MTDYCAGSYTVAKQVHPIFTRWRPETVNRHIKLHKRRARRTYKQYLRTGDARDFNRSQRKITSWDFD